MSSGDTAWREDEEDAGRKVSAEDDEDAMALQSKAELDGRIATRLAANRRSERGRSNDVDILKFFSSFSQVRKIFNA